MTHLTSPSCRFLRRTLALLLLVVVACGSHSALADTALITFDNCTATSYDSSSKNNRLVGNSGDTAEGFILDLTGNASKAYSGASSLTVPLPDGTSGSRTTIKLSNGAENTLYLPSGKVATSITFYSYVNAEAVGTSYWSQVGDATFTQDNAELFKCNKKDVTSPDVQTFSLNRLSKIKFKNAGTQVCVIIEVEYEDSYEWTTVYSWQSPDGNPVEMGGTAQSVGGSDNRVNYRHNYPNDSLPTKTVYSLCLNSKYTEFDDASKTHIEITLDEPLRAGDSILVTAYRVKDSQSTLYIRYADESGNAMVDVADAQEYNVISDSTDPTTNFYIVPAKAAGCQLIKLTRNTSGTSLLITHLEIKRLLAEVTTENVLTSEKLTATETDDHAGTVTIVRAASNVDQVYTPGEVVTIAAAPSYGYRVIGFRQADTELAWQTSLVTFSDGTSATLPNCAYTLPSGYSTVQVIYAHDDLYAVTATASLDADGNPLGEVSLEPSYEALTERTDRSVTAWFTVGTQVTAIAEAADGYVVDSWTDADNRSTRNTYAFKMTAAERTLSVSFKKGVVGSVVFSVEGADVNGVTEAYKGAQSLLPDAHSRVSSFTVPTNYTFYKSDHTLQYWHTADDDRYYPGKTYYFASADPITLTPVFAANQASPSQGRISDPLLRYDFGTGVHTYDDPNTGQTRKVCAQKVRVGKNSNIFWTSQNYIRLLVDGEELDDDFDVPLTVNTGTSGHMRNGDLDDWASFGPGTTLWVNSCTGAKISLMTYAPITSTTIDGCVPTLDTDDARCLPDKFQYVYSFTTSSADTLLPIVIGDDYSYYQWLEVATLAANMVTLHTTVDADTHGSVTSVKSIGSYEGIKLSDGGYSFHQGEQVRITFAREFGYEFDRILDVNKLVDGEPLAVLSLNADGTASIVRRDAPYVVDVLQPNADGSWGDSDHAFILRVIESTDAYTTYQVDVNISDHRDLQICFRDRATYYITYSPGSEATGTAPVAQWVEAGDGFTVPYNNTLYYEGHTLTYWHDDSFDTSLAVDDAANVGHVYRAGVTYTAPAEHLRLTPVFEPNAFTLLEADGKATWHLTTGDGAPTISYEKTAGILVTQLYKDSKKTEWIDLSLYLDAKVRTLYTTDEDGNVSTSTVRGKFNNTSLSTRMQINVHSYICFPATPECEVSISATSSTTEFVVGGVTHSDGTCVGGTTITGKTATATCSGLLAVDTVYVAKSCYGIDFAVTYKPQSSDDVPALTSLTIGGTTLTTDELDALTTSTDKSLSIELRPTSSDADVEMPLVEATASSDGVVTISTATLDQPVTTVTVATAAGVIAATYTINYVFCPSLDETVLPRILSIKVNDMDCPVNPTDEQRLHYTDQPVNGRVVVEFSHTMQAATYHVSDRLDDGTLYEIDLTSDGGTTLSFNYWDLPTDKTFDVTWSAGSFVDIYGNACPDVVSFKLSSSATSIPVVHRTFDFVVGLNGDVDEAIAAAEAQTGSDRYYIFVPDGEYELSGNTTNSMTKLSRSAVSIIGQSQKGTILYNTPSVGGISSAVTLHVTGTDFYAEELTLENRFDYWGMVDQNVATQAVAFRDEGGKNILKNVNLWSWQDTYYSSGVADDFRGYLEDCALAGIVDWMCGTGDIWFERCDIVVRDRTGNNIAAPSTLPTQQWGYVYNNCHILPEDENPQNLKGKDWTLARPWNSSGVTKSPACTYLNTRMSTLPRDAGWGSMGDGCVLRFHEYQSLAADGQSLISLGTRSLAAASPAAGSDDCVLTAEQAAQYTLRNVLSGTDSFDPTVYTEQIDAASCTTGEVDPYNSLTWDDQVELDDARLQWKPEPMALCYLVFKLNVNTGLWEYRTSAAQQADDETLVGVSLERYGAGTYCVRAANQRGGLGAPTKAIVYAESDTYTLTITQDEGADEGYGWATLCLPYNAKNPEPEHLSIYAATEVVDYTLTLLPVTVLNSGRGYVVYGAVGSYEFKSSSATSEVETILDGNPEDYAISRGNNNCYVLANKPDTYGIGFYRFTGTKLAAHRAWLTVDRVSSSTSQVSASRAITFKVLMDDATDLTAPRLTAPAAPRLLPAFDLMGRPVNSTRDGQIYIREGRPQLCR